MPHVLNSRGLGYQWWCTVDWWDVSDTGGGYRNILMNHTTDGRDEIGDEQEGRNLSSDRLLSCSDI
ncbi:hypothetical protein A9A89_2141 [Bifidobacterium psychraerophilum DSM 22366]|nr:hypothetical protein A9A89_2141 [Bifidobacterium psychraerophilum DSM 22366]